MTQCVCRRAPQRRLGLRGQSRPDGGKNNDAKVHGYFFNRAEKANEREWLEEIFGSFFERRVPDGQHKFFCDNAIVFDAFINANDLAYYTIRRKKCFLVHFRGPAELGFAAEARFSFSRYFGSGSRRISTAAD